MERGIQQADGDRLSFHCDEHLDEVLFLHGKYFFESSLAGSCIVGADHLTHFKDPGSLEEHMLRAAQAYAFSSEIQSGPCILRGIGIGSDAEPSYLISPFHDSREITREAGFSRGDLPEIYVAGRTVYGDIISLDDLLAFYCKVFFMFVYCYLRAASNAALAHSSGYDCGMRGHSASGCKDAHGGVHSFNILGRRFPAHEDHVFAALCVLCRIICSEVYAADGGSWGSRKSGGSGGRICQSLTVKSRMHQL